MKIIESFKEEINNSLKEKKKKKIQTGKQLKELNKVIQELKVEVETIKKTQTETNLEMGNIRKRSGITDVINTDRI
jgi:F0F1-type ATP synthase membrane subunit b/b'